MRKFGTGADSSCRGIAACDRIRMICLHCLGKPANLQHRFGEGCCDRVGATGSDPLLGFGHSASEIPQADNDRQVRKSCAQPFAQGTCLPNRERRKRRHTSDAIVTARHLLQHIVDSADREIMNAVSGSPE